MERRVMKRSGVVYLFIASLLMVFVLAGGAWAEEPNDPNSCGCCEVDRPGEGPPAGSSVLSSSTAPLALAATSLSSNTKTFRTDTGPELDWYQPCNGGDNEIDFNINVHDVEISSITSATLTLAVWDVDYDCGGGCCERDSVYLNGHRLTTPEEYLTGANQQWSTVTFNVDPSWIVDGDNYVQIFIDLFCPHPTWCVTCDWGELSIQTEEVDVSIESKDISISPKSWWEFWKKPFDISATVHNNGAFEVQNIEVKLIKRLSGVELKSETKTINTIAAGGTASVSVNWNLSYDNDIEVTVDPDDKIDEGKEGNNFAQTTKTTGKIKNSAGTALPHLLVKYQGKNGSNWDDKVTVFTNNAGQYSIINNMSSITEGGTGRIQASLRYSPTDNENKSAFRLIDEAQWGNGYYPNSDTPISKSSGQWVMNKESSQTVDLTISDNEGGIVYTSMGTCYNYHKDGGRVPSGETQVEVGDNDFSGPYRIGNTIHMSPTFLGSNPCPSALGHEYTHLIEDGWSITKGGGGHDPQFPVQEGSCHWGSCIARGTSIMVYPNNITLNNFINIDISNNNQTNGGPPAPIIFIGAREEFQIAGTMWDLTPSHVWSTLRHGGFWWWQHPDTPENFYTYYKDRDSRSSPTIKNIFKAHNYNTTGWPGKNGKDPNNFTGNYSDSKVDENADGFAEYLEVLVELDINEAGYYYVFGEISGLEYGSSNYLHLDVGIQNVPLRFYGEYIFEAALDGPYTFSGFLADEDYNTVDYRLDVYTTAAYNHTEFKLPALFFTGNSSDSGIDTDSDSFYDELRVTAEVNVVESGDYQIYGYLYGDANFIAEASVLVHLDVAIQSVQLTFEGKTIYASNIDGPYEVATSIPRGQEFYTSAYSHTEFITPGAAIDQIASDSGTDTDYDGLYDYLAIEISIDCNSAGSYMLSGHLYDGSESHITSAYTNNSLISGTQNVQLNFDGIAIRNEGKEGPYDLTIELRDDEGILIGSKTGSTSNYSCAQFQMAQQNYFQMAFTDYGTDTGSNGLYDFLTMDVNISSTLKTGNYRLDGYLYDPNNNFITSAITTTPVGTGSNITQFNFRGQHIWMSKITNGSYDLDVKVFDSNDVLIVVLEDVYTTSTYNYSSFEPPVTVFQGTYSDYGTDLNGDGYYEILTVDVGIDVQIADTYKLVGRMYDGNDSEIVSTSNLSYLNTGSQSMTLIFDGPSIYRHGINGPYHLKNLMLYDSNDMLVDLEHDAHTTTAYNYTQFQRPPVVLTGNYSDHAIDLNSDGVYEYLRVDVEVIVANAGNYALNARLMDQAEDEIVWASTTAWLPADQSQTLQLNFNGSSIYSHGVNGPYYVRDVYVYNMSNTGLSDYVYDAYVTQNHWSVGNQPPIANAGSDQGVVCAYNTEQGTRVTLNGTGSSDPDGDPLTYTWTGPFDESPEHGATPTVTFTPGCPEDYVITLVVNDGTEDSNPDEVVVTLQNPVTAVTYDGDTLLSTAGSPTVNANLVVSLRDIGDNVLDIDNAKITCTLTAEGIGTIVAEANSQDGFAQMNIALEPAIYEIQMTLNCSNIVSKAIIVIYNPEGGFATGGGWIVPEPDGLNTHPNVRANFGFNAKYQKGKATGHIEFRYSDGHIDLKSTSIEQLVITGGKIAQFKGWASVNGEAGNWFFAKAIDNGEPGTNDIFDIKVWSPGISIEGDPSERAGGVLQGGNIVVHTKKK